MDTKMENNIPIPSDRKVWDFKDFQVGQSKFYNCIPLAEERGTTPREEAYKLARYARNYGYNRKWKFTCRCRTEGVDYGVRVWRKA